MRPFERGQLVTVLRKAAVAMSFGGTALQAQSRIAGTAMDSLSGSARPLNSAVITLPELNRWADADSAGRFTFEGVPAGRYAVVIMHPLLDSLDIALPPTFIDVPSSGEVAAAVSIPSVRTLHRLLCGADLNEGAGLLLGRVSLGDRTRPDSGFVQLTWSVTGVVNAKLAPVTQTASVSLRAGATFIACGVPAEKPIRLQALTHLGSSSLIEISVANATLRHLPIVMRTGEHHVSFSLTTSKGKPLQSVKIASLGARDSARTNAAGHTKLLVTAGTQSVSLQMVGFEMQTRLLDVARDTLLSVMMSPTAVALTPQRIVGRLDRMLPAGFESRRIAGFGAFLGPETIEQLGGLELGSLLVQARGVTLGGMVKGRSMPLLRGLSDGRCIPNYFVDGAAFVVESVLPSPGRTRTFADLDAAVPTASILAIEVYASPVGIPPEFDLSSSTGCGTILIWTKRGRTPR